MKILIIECAGLILYYNYIPKSTIYVVYGYVEYFYLICFVPTTQVIFHNFQPCFISELGSIVINIINFLINEKCEQSST